MKKLQVTRQFTVEEKKTVDDKEWYALFGEAATKFFYRDQGDDNPKHNCYWIAWKYPRVNIDRAWSIAQKNNDRTLANFIQNIRT